MLDRTGHEVMAKVLRCVDRGQSSALELFEMFADVYDQALMDVATDVATKIVDEKGTDVLDR
jgi:hypothetical protein